MKVSFLLNGKLLGDAFSLPEGVRTSGFLPHVCLRNARLELNTKQQSSFHEIVQPQTIFIGDAPAHKSVENSVERPASLSDCECICMVGLPAAGKSSWVERHCARSKGRNFAVLSVRGMVSRMRTDPSVPSAASDWSAARSLFEKSVALLCAGWPRPRHSIIDDCNTDSAGRNRLLKRLQVMGLVQAIVVMPEDCEYKARRAQAEAADGCVTEQELVRLQSYLTMPEKGPMCADVHWAELGESACTDLAREYRRLARERARKLEIGVIKDHTSPPIQHISPRRLSSNMNVPEETRGFAQERILKVRLPGQTTTSPRETTLTVRLPKTAASSCPRDGVARHAVTLCPRKDHRRVEPYPSGRRVNVVSRGMADSSVLHTQPELDRSTRVVTVGCPSAPSSEVISTQRISPDRGGKNIGDKLLKGTRKIFLTGSRIVRRNAFLN
ncbi:MAG: hypothetical protein KVP17_000440 [Porospora cf. gigantea B]|uniref:uncharacterized protein n=1 Tax=Porospora cf. gigantea B TaxID=2853592 RepID=UPI003571845E|nr:MAG: hypothetical protein KVP17_000440 [Porospora cf. gigantea B]